MKILTTPQEFFRVVCRNIIQLTNLADYIEFWNDDWAEALVTFHPEYCYVDFAKQICQLTNTLSLENDEGTRGGFYYYTSRRL